MDEKLTKITETYECGPYLIEVDVRWGGINFSQNPAVEFPIGLPETLKPYTFHNSPDFRKALLVAVELAEKYK